MVAGMEVEFPAGVRSAVHEAKAGDLMAPVFVWAPNAEAARACSRMLAAEGGVVNVRFVTGCQLADLVTPPTRRLPKARKLTSDLRRELARVVAAGARPPL